MNERPDGPTPLSLGIVGFPLAQSISPAFQQAALDSVGYAADYHLWPTPPVELHERIARLRLPNYLGANITVPHKEAVRPMLDALGPWAGRVGAVNTIVKDGARLVGHNTDVAGFLAGLEEVGFEPREARVLILGAGGAARAAVYGLAEQGAESIVIANRTAPRAQALADELSPAVAVVAVGSDRFADAAAAADLIVNCTSLGMRHGAHESSSPIPGEMIPEGSLVYDMVYVPRETPLIRSARAAGARTQGGLAMLVHQGAAAFELWTGLAPPVDVMMAAAERALAEQDKSARAARD